MKRNVKLYQLHKCSAKNTWIIDLMFCDKLVYLVAINVNTRYLFVELINEMIEQGTFTKQNLKSSVMYLKALQRMIDKGMNVKHLIGDGEGAFNSTLANESFYNSRGIDFKSVPRQLMGNYPEFMKKEQRNVKSDPNHTSLSIIDQVIRTIRDMAYVMKVGVITPNVMNVIVNQYNNAPHKGLSKYAGFSVSPQMVNDDEELEEYIVRKICQANWRIIHSYGFKLNEGTNVKVYNDKDVMDKRRTIVQPGKFKVVGFKNGLYQVEGVVNGKNRIQMVPRWKLHYAF